MNNDTKRPPTAHAAGAPVTVNLNIRTAGPRGPALLQDVWPSEKLPHFARQVIPESRIHAKGPIPHPGGPCVWLPCSPPQVSRPLQHVASKHLRNPLFLLVLP
ncbi:hypothetical protein V1280_007419 [Bradyrhizobium sp. AZCC 2230]